MYILNMIFDVILSALVVIQSALGFPFANLVFNFNAQASVFETGDEMYTVMWSTNLPGTGYVTYSFEGKDYTVADMVNGLIRTTDTVHTVRIPKEHLNNNTYSYHSQQVGTKRAYVAVKGRTLSSNDIHFKGYNGQEKVNALVISDIHENPSPVDKTVRQFKTEYDLVVINGDAVSLMTTPRKFVQVLTYANRYSKGEIPVVYVMGNHENRGDYAVNLPRFFQSSTGGLYFTFNYGPVSFLVLDSGEDKADDDWTYSGLVDYTSLIAKETEWMKSLKPDTDATYRICLTHIPYINDRYGQNWIEPLADLQMDAVITAHKHMIDLHYEDEELPFHRIVDGGKTDDHRYIASMLTFENGNMKVTAIDNTGALLAEETFRFN